MTDSFESICLEDEGDHGYGLERRADDDGCDGGRVYKPTAAEETSIGIRGSLSAGYSYVGGLAGRMLGRAAPAATSWTAFEDAPVDTGPMTSEEADAFDYDAEPPPQTRVEALARSMRD
eukprot:gene8530-7789_t